MSTSPNRNLSQADGLQLAKGYRPPASLPPWPILDPLLLGWLAEDIGRGDRATQALFPDAYAASGPITTAELRLKQPGKIAGLPLFQRVFHLLDPQVSVTAIAADGTVCPSGTTVAQLRGPMAAVLTGERVALNLIMHLSGIATLTERYVTQLADLPTQLLDTRKTTPGLRLLEKYATKVGGAVNHRWGLDDAVMLKDNHIAAAGGIAAAIALARAQMPMPLTLEVETETLEQVQAVLAHKVDIIMLDNMPPPMIVQAVQLIRQRCEALGHDIKIEASGNITLETIRTVAQTGVDYISTSAPITQASWLDLSLKLTDNRE